MSLYPASRVALFLLVVAGGVGWWLSRPQGPVPPPVTTEWPQGWTPGPLPGGGQSLQARPLDWQVMQSFAGTQSANEIRRALETLYVVDKESWTQVFQLDGDRFTIRTSSTATEPATCVLSLAKADSAPPSPPPRYWRPARQAAPALVGRILQDVHVAIDPGHIGGEWAKMEERWYQLDGQGIEIKEGELSLQTAFIAKARLEALGARVSLLRESTTPVTSFRPSDFEEGGRSRSEAERMFYRQAEIRARADLVNLQLKPDLVLCLHLNAEPWGNDAGKPVLTSANHLHLLVNGHYGNDEITLDDHRYEMLLRLLQRTHEEEIPLSVSVARSMAAATGLPAYDYNRGHMAGNAHQADPDSPYVWARNLLAGRLYQCPVVFCEPYVMNCREVYDRIAAGDYEGEREVSGVPRKSLFREYADSVVAGVEAYYRQHRRITE